MAEHLIVVERRVHVTVRVPGSFENRRGEVAEVRLLANQGEYDELLDAVAKSDRVYETRYVCTFEPLAHVETDP